MYDRPSVRLPHSSSERSLVVTMTLLRWTEVTSPTVQPLCRVLMSTRSPSATLFAAFALEDFEPMTHCARAPHSRRPFRRKPVAQAPRAVEKFAAKLPHNANDTNPAMHGDWGLAATSGWCRVRCLSMGTVKGLQVGFDLVQCGCCRATTCCQAWACECSDGGPALQLNSHPPDNRNASMCHIDPACHCPSLHPASPLHHV